MIYDSLQVAALEAITAKAGEVQVLESVRFELERIRVLCDQVWGGGGGQKCSAPVWGETGLGHQAPTLAPPHSVDPTDCMAFTFPVAY